MRTELNKSTCILEKRKREREKGKRKEGKKEGGREGGRGKEGLKDVIQVRENNKKGKFIPTWRNREYLKSMMDKHRRVYF